MSYCEVPDFFSESVRAAKKPWRCCECGQSIPAGLLYWYCVGKWDGDISTYRQHIECRDACFAFRDHMDGECVGFGELSSVLADYGQSWEDKGFDVVRNEFPEHVKKIRSLFAAGHWASRLNGDAIKQYNLKHNHRRGCK